jgi:hypothetical protein
LAGYKENPDNLSLEQHAWAIADAMMVEYDLREARAQAPPSDEAVEIGGMPSPQALDEAPTKVRVEP